MTDPLIQQLVEARKAAGLTQRQLADVMGTVQSHISELEGGQHDIHLGTLRRWALAVGLELPPLRPVAYETAPAVCCTPAGNGAPRLGEGPAVDGAPASDPAVAEGGSRADVARCEQCDGTGVEALRWLGKNNWRPVDCTACSPVARTLDVTEATAALARERR